MDSAESYRTPQKQLEAIFRRACAEDWCASMDCTVCAGARFFVACATLVRGKDRNLSVLTAPAKVEPGQRLPRRLSQRTPWTATAQARLSSMAETLPLEALLKDVIPTRLLAYMALLSRYVRDHETATQSLCVAWIPQLTTLLPSDHPLQLDLKAAFDKRLPLGPLLLGRLIRTLADRTFPLATVGDAAKVCAIAL